MWFHQIDIYPKDFTALETFDNNIYSEIVASDEESSDDEIEKKDDDLEGEVTISYYSMEYQLLLNV